MNNDFNNNLNISNDANNNFEGDNPAVNQQLTTQEITKVNSNSDIFNKKNLVLAIVITIIVIGFFVFKLNNNSKSNVNIVDLGDKVISLQKGDELTVNAWNPPVKIKLNEEKIETENTPKLYNGVTLGTNVKDVIEKFNINEGYAILNMEVSSEEHDGTTDIVEKSFENYNSIPEYFLDCVIVFGYNKVNGKWRMVKETNILDADIIYYIDINGFSNEMYGKNEVIMFSIKYNK